MNNAPQRHTEPVDVHLILRRRSAGIDECCSRAAPAPSTKPGSGTFPPDGELPAGYVLDKTRTRLVFPWPGPPSTQPESLATANFHA